MALEILWDFIRFLELSPIEKMRMDGILCLSREGGRNHLSGTFTTIPRSTTPRKYFPNSGDNWASRISAVMCFNHQFYLRSFACETRQCSLFNSLLMASMFLLPEFEYKQFLRMDFRLLVILEDYFYSCCAGGYIVFEDIPDSERKTVADSSTWNMSTMSYHLECPIEQRIFIEIITKAANFFAALYAELKSDSNFEEFDLRFDHLLMLGRFCHVVGDFVFRVSGMSLMSIPTKPICGQIEFDFKNLIVMNSYAFAEWLDYSSGSELDALWTRWRACVCTTPCSKSPCVSKKVSIALFGPASNYKDLRSWLSSRCARAFQIAKNRVRLS